MDVNRLSLSKYRLTQKGFTLIELSIVLVVIGLLVGGILTAQSLIASAKMTRLIKTLQQYDIATQNFEIRYNQLPGDSSLFTPAGDGDGKIYIHDHSYQLFNQAAHHESLYFWKHLNQSGDITNQHFVDYSGPALFTGDFTGLVPDLEIGDKCFLNAYTLTVADGAVTGSDWGNSWVISQGQPQGIGECLTAISALALDTKLDDGNPIAGDIQNMYNYSGPRIAGNGYAGDCITFTPWPTASYAIASSSARCELAIKTHW